MGQCVVVHKGHCVLTVQSPRACLMGVEADSRGEVLTC